MTSRTKMRRLAQRLEAMDPQSRIAFVFYGSGTNMAFHAGAVEALLKLGAEDENRTSPFSPTSKKAPILVAGRGVGALVGAMYAQGFEAFQGELLPELFALSRRRRIHSGPPLLRLVCAQEGYYNLRPLSEMIDRLVKVNRFIIPFVVGALSTHYEPALFTPADGQGILCRALLASCSTVPLHAPVKIGSTHFMGGAGPLGVGDIVRLGIRRIVVFSSAPLETLSRPFGGLNSPLARLEHSISVLQNAAIRADLHTADIVNDLVSETMSTSDDASPILRTLHAPQRTGFSDRLYHQLEICTIAPKHSLLRNPYISRAAIQQDFNVGRARAHEVLRECEWLREYTAS